MGCHGGAVYEAESDCGGGAVSVYSSSTSR